MKRRPSKIYSVYGIDIEGITRYIGSTGDLKRREKEHNYLCFKKAKKKDLYDKIRALGSQTHITLYLIKTFKTRVEAKRFEALLILEDWFNERNLWQKVPHISDF
jgi:predicted GIY-YIG superfamily endonuclease